MVGGRTENVIDNMTTVSPDVSLNGQLSHSTHNQTIYGYVVVADSFIMPLIFSWVIHFLSLAISPDMPNGSNIIL